MPKQKTNQGPCSIHNCDKESTIFRSLTDNAFAKALATGTLQQYSYLQIDQQICNAHYMEIVENPWNNFRKNYQNNISSDNIIENNNSIDPLSQLSLADKIKKMTTIIYNRQRKESATLGSIKSYHI
ncbi:21541_t:CDS:2 [Dentiscutata erythropus]|uniref:21541_t:CDS:1 n=1 Tax=Dentiscutata erythropus TaxID=1348616 RepID=A0A9N9J6L8_9GLOM|nr:21541_t:CDS:2 [Dentiscutata erythropus]